MRLRTSLVLFVFALCAAHQALASKLSDIFQPDMLQAQVPYLETITGPAMHLYPGLGGIVLRDYRIEGCRVGAYARGTTVLGYSLALTPTCNIDLHSFIGNKHITTSGLTVGKLATEGTWYNIHAESDCIYSCGNAADPTIDFIFEAPHSINFLTVVLTVVLADTPSLDAVEKWRAVMQKSEGKEYIAQRGFNCTSKYDDFAVRAFANVAAHQITVGHKPNSILYEMRCKNR